MIDSLLIWFKRLFGIKTYVDTMPTQIVHMDEGPRLCVNRRISPNNFIAFVDHQGYQISSNTVEMCPYDANERDHYKVIKKTDNNLDPLN